MKKIVTLVIATMLFVSANSFADAKNKDIATLDICGASTVFVTDENSQPVYLIIPFENPQTKSQSSLSSEGKNPRKCRHTTVFFYERKQKDTPLL